MNTIKLTVASALFSLAGVAVPSGSSFLGTLDLTPPAAPRETTDCANFTGAWKGTCTTSEGKKVEEAFAINQKSCEMIEVATDKQKVMLPVGGVFSAGGAIPGAPAVTFGSDITSSWNKEKTVLSIAAMGGGKKLAIDEAGGGFFAKEEAKLENGKLVVNIAAMAGDKKTTVACEFDKQN